MHLRHRARRPTARDLSTPPVASRSAAWLEGERLFQAPPVRPAEPAVPVVVKIRRSRLTGMPEATETPPGDEAAEDSAGWKGPRVFRVEPASNELQPPTDELAPEAAAAEALVVEPLPPVPRRRRVGADRRPGPVVVRVFQPEPAAAPEEPAEPSGGRRIAALQAAMAEVGRILAEASRARALRF